MVTRYTASGARRLGDEYQDLHSAEVLVEWLEHPDAYRWVRLETMEGSLDDIQAECADGSRRLLQVKFGLDDNHEWDWEQLLKQEQGNKGSKPSLIQKWKVSLYEVRTSGVRVREAALITNRSASAAIRTNITDGGVIRWSGLSESIKVTLSEQLGGEDDASSFFACFQFHFRERSPQAMEEGLKRRFHRLGGMPEGWTSLLRHIQRWINRQDEPTSSGKITLSHLRAAALWHLPPQIPQEFLVPSDYVAPEQWSKATVETHLRVDGDRLAVVTGRPGAGKSTYLSWLANHLQSVETPTVRHHYFLSTTDATPNRMAWQTAANSIIGQLRTQYPELVQSVHQQNPTPEELRNILSAAGAAQGTRQSFPQVAPLVVIVDGLDHVWRDTGSDDGLRQLFEHLLPPPAGVVVVVGTQDIDLARLPKRLRDLCPRSTWLEVPVLSWEEIRRWLQFHEGELELPNDPEHAARVLDELTTAFQHASGGHPLILQYTLASGRDRGYPLRAQTVKTLPPFDTGSTVAAYYQTLWDASDPEGHSLLHLLAGFPWAWPRDGLIRCLTELRNPAPFERAERAIRHVLGNSPAGITAFHESLLAFVRALPDHKDNVQILRPQVISWLTQRAPAYWRWRHEWEERAKNGDVEPLIMSATLDWCVESLVAGRDRRDIAAVVASSGWAALTADRLGVATERDFLYSYLSGAVYSDGVLPRLVWLALLALDEGYRELTLRLFLSRASKETIKEIELVAEAAFSFGQREICKQLLDVCERLWNSAVQRSDLEHDQISSLRQALPLLTSANLTNDSASRYQQYVAKHLEDPHWCSRWDYVKALARLCAVGGTTDAVRRELRLMANHSENVSFPAVDEIVRLACRDGFDPASWFESSKARRSGMYRCYLWWVRDAKVLAVDAPREVSFLKNSAVHDEVDEDNFTELARAFFFSCLACATEGRQAPAPIGLDVKATKVADFLSKLRDLAIEAVSTRKAGLPLGAAWFIARLATTEPPAVRPNDYVNSHVMRGSVAQVIVAIAQDLEALHFAETQSVSLTRQVVLSAIESGWTTQRAWLDDRVERRLRMQDSDAAQLLLDREFARLKESKDYLPTRAQEYGILAQFCHLHQKPADEVRRLARLSAQNLLGHGYRKDTVIADILDGIRQVPGTTRSETLARLAPLSRVIQVVDEITDGRETSQLKGELAETLWATAPETLPRYVRALQRNYHHGDVESIFTNLSRVASFESEYERALGQTLVHEAALTALQQRAERGDLDAKSVLTSTLNHCGREAATTNSEEEGTHSSASEAAAEEGQNLPPVDVFTPQSLAGFVKTVRDLHIYADEHLAAWTSHWRNKDPDALLAALSKHRVATGHPLEQETGPMIVDLALERSGQDAAWEWMIVYHQAAFGWSSYGYAVSDAEWIWQLVGRRFASRWREFILATANPVGASVRSAPQWSVERMVLYLKAVGQEHRVAEVLDAALKWVSALTADMQLPDPHIEPELPELPVALRLLIDRLDCPSRMVQERAAWSVAEILAKADTREATITAFLGWHAREALEFRSCLFLLIVHLAHLAHGMSASACMEIARKAQLVPSVGVDLLLREFGTEGVALAATVKYGLQHSGRPGPGFSLRKDFEKVVGGHLAPVVMRWSRTLDASGIPFTRQWAWEATCLARKVGLSLEAGKHFEDASRSHGEDPALAISDRLSAVLRSAYLRALHWSLDKTWLDPALAHLRALHIAIMADPTAWSVRPSLRPTWWPQATGDSAAIDTIGEIVGEAIRDRFNQRNPNEAEIVIFASGPVGCGQHMRAEIEISAFLQAANGPMKPSLEVLAGLPPISCRPVPLRTFLPGSYMTFNASEECFFQSDDWMLAPLAWWLNPATVDWLLPDRQHRGIHLPATWLMSGAPTITTQSNQLSISLGDQPVARFQYWHDDLRERSYHASPSRVGSELLLRRDFLEPHLAAGATLCWVVTMSVAQREQYTRDFGEPTVVGSWLIGGSRLALARPWRPPL